MGIIPRSLLRNLFPKLALGFIPVIAYNGKRSGGLEHKINMDSIKRKFNPAIIGFT